MRFAERWPESSLSAFSLLFAGGTLVCCALPSLLVSLGLGSTVAALVGAAPWLVTLSQAAQDAETDGRLRSLPDGTFVVLEAIAATESAADEGLSVLRLTLPDHAP